MKGCADYGWISCALLLGDVKVCRLSMLLIASCALASARYATGETSDCTELWDIANLGEGG
jgi:hypothetical protein